MLMFHPHSGFLFCLPVFCLSKCAREDYYKDFFQQFVKDEIIWGKFRFWAFLEKSFCESSRLAFNVEKSHLKIMWREENFYEPKLCFRII